MDSQCQPPHLLISPTYPTLGSPSSHSHNGSSTQIDGSLQGSKSQTERNDAHSWIWDEQTGRNRHQVTIDILPEDVLLDIFDLLVVESHVFEAERWWRTLAHVCRKWRIVVFGSPHRLNLRLVCSDRTSVREMLDVWPPLPIVIHQTGRPKSGWDNIIAALKLKDRVCQITMELDRQRKKVLRAMQEPFPALTHLNLSSDIEILPVALMGRSAPRLRYLELKHVPIRGLPELLLSATDLVHLDLLSIPRSGYISPEAIVACLSTLPRLEMLHLAFESPHGSRPIHGIRRLPQATRSVLPALIRFCFTGVREYLEDLVARFDSPQLDHLDIIFFNQLISDTPQLTQFIGRTPRLKVRCTCMLQHSLTYCKLS